MLPSYEENWAIVIGEAMGARLPVITYGLNELKIVWQDNIIPVAVGDTSAFAREIVRLLDSPEEQAALATKARQYVARLDWSAIAERELNAVLPTGGLSAADIDPQSKELPVHAGRN